MILSLLLALCAFVRADTTVELGATHATLVPTGIWWQHEYTHQLPKDVPAAGIRFDQSIGQAWSVGAGFTYVGRFRSHAQAIASDQAYDTHVSYPLSDWYGDERVQALYLVARRSFGKWFVEAGPVLTRSTWSMTIPNYLQCAQPYCLAPDVYPPYWLRVGGKRQTRHDPMAAIGYQLTSRAGVRLAAYPTRISDSYGGPGITKGYSSTFTLTLKI